MQVGGTKRFDFAAIDELKPDLIIGNKEENYQDGINQLRQIYPVWMSDIFHLEDALDMMLRIGALTSRERMASMIVQQIKEKFASLSPSRRARVLYLIWRKPWMAAGQNTFINDMLLRNGLENVVQGDRYPELDNDDFKLLDPDYVFLSSEPFPFRENHTAELSQLSPRSRVMLVDGEMFSWYGSRLLHAGEYFQSLQL